MSLRPHLSHLETDLAEDLRIFMIICMFEIILATVFALLQGSDRDHEKIVIVVMFQMVVTMLTILPFWSHVREGIVVQGFASLAVSGCRYLRSPLEPERAP